MEKTIDRTWVVNHHPGKTLSICLFESCSHQEFWPILHSLRLLTVACTRRAVHSGHKLDTTFSFHFGPFVMSIPPSLIASRALSHPSGHFFATLFKSCQRHLT